MVSAAARASRLRGVHCRRLPYIRRSPTKATTFLIDFLALVPQPLIEVVQARGTTTVSKQPASVCEGWRRRFF